MSSTPQDPNQARGPLAAMSPAGAAYVDAMGHRMAADGSSVQWQRLGPLEALVGYQQVTATAALSTLHCVSATVWLPTVTANDVHGFSPWVTEHARARSNALLGMQSGIASIPVLVSEHVTEDAVQAVLAGPVTEFAVVTWPVIVDLQARRVIDFQGTRFVGGLLHGTIRERVSAILPPL